MSFHIVGELRGMYCIYDSGDYSCEYIKLDRLKRAGIKIDNGGYPSVPIYKLKTLYDFEFESYSPDLTYHYGAVSENDDLLWETELGVSIYIDKGCLSYPESKWLEKMMQKYGYYEDCVPRLLLSSTNSICWGRRYMPDEFSNSTYSFVVPPLMLNYILKLFKEKNFTSFVNAFDGLLTYQIKVDPKKFDVSKISRYSLLGYEFCDDE